MPWEFEREGEVVTIEPTGPLVAMHMPAALRAFVDFVRNAHGQA